MCSIITGKSFSLNTYIYTVWLEIFEAKKVRCFRGFRVNLELIFLSSKLLKYKSTLIACNLCDNFRNDNRLFPDGDAFKLDPKKRLPYPSGPLSTIVPASAAKRSSKLLNSILQGRTSPIACLPYCIIAVVSMYH